MKRTLFFLLLLITCAAPLRAAVTSAHEYDAMGMALYEKGFYAQALEFFRSSVQADTYNWQGWQNLGNAQLKLGDRNSAVKAFERSLEINPQNAVLRVLVENLRSGASLPAPQAPVQPLSSPAAPAVVPSPTAPAAVPSPSPFAQPDPAIIPDVEPTPTPFPAAPVPAQPFVPPPTPVPPAPVPTVYKAPARPYEGDGSPLGRSRLWFKAGGLYNFSLQSDLATSADHENQMIEANGWTGSASMGPHGFGFGFEAGYFLAPQHAAALGVQFLRASEYGLNQSLNNGSPPDFENEAFTPWALPVSLDYYFFLPNSLGRLFCHAGASYYFAGLGVADDFSYLISHPGSMDADTFSGTLTGGGIGFQAGIGQEFPLSSSFGLSVFARGRYARISNLTGTLTRPDGTTGEYGLAVFPTGEVHAIAVSVIGNSGIEYASLDFAGFDAGVAVSFYP